MSTRGGRSVAQSEGERTTSGAVAEQRPDTAAAILEHAAELFAQKGFGQTSIREIAEGAGVTKPMLYYYFGNKAGLIRHLVDVAIMRFIEGCEAATAHVGIEPRLSALTQDQILFSEEHPALVTLMLRLDAMPPDVALSLDIQKEQQRCIEALLGLLDGAPDLRFDALTTSFSYLGLLVTHLVGRLRAPPTMRPLCADAARTLVHGFLYGFVSAAPAAPAGDSNDI